MDPGAPLAVWFTTILVKLAGQEAAPKKCFRAPLELYARALFFLVPIFSQEEERCLVELGVSDLEGRLQGSRWHPWCGG